MRSHPTPAEGKTIGTNGALVRVGSRHVLVVGMDLTSSGAAGSWRDARRRVEAAADATQYDRWTTWTWDGRGTAFNGGRLDVVTYSAGALRAVDARVWNTELMPADTLRVHDLTADASRTINRHRPVVVDLAFRR